MKAPKDKKAKSTKKSDAKLSKQTDKKSKTLNIALLGLGTVGGGVMALLKDNQDQVAARLGISVQITHVGVRHIRDDIPKKITQSTDLLALCREPSVDIVVEVIGGTDTAFEVIKTAISHGKHIVTANKALLAKHGNEIFAQATKAGVRVGYEAAVAGGIPIIKVLKEALAGGRVAWLAGIINGTSNFILSKMSDDNHSFDKALKEAQKLGYAEADPTFDIEGVDAAHKLSILAAIAFGVPINFGAVYCEGIGGVQNDDVRYAKKLGYHIKHLGFAQRRDNGLELRVHPTLIPKKTMLAHVNGVKNAVLVSSAPLGQSLYYGDGAGAGATASAVVADIMDIGAGRFAPHLGFCAPNDTPIIESAHMKSGWYLRVQALNDEASVLTSITRILSDNGIIIDALLQQPNQSPTGVPIIIMTHEVSDGAINDAIDQIEALPTVLAKVARIRVADLD